MKPKTIAQWIYGSTPWSAGYSVLARSENLESRLEDAILKYCETYDAQKHALAHHEYAVSIYRIEGSFFIFTETFGGWKDQVGRDSRVMRSVVLSKEAWELLKGNPFLISWILPAISSCIPKKRNETNLIADIPLKNIEKIQEKLWYKETKFFFKALSLLSTPERNFLLFLQKKDFPFETLEISVEKDASLLARAIVYSIDKEKRADCQIDSFSLNDHSPQGICFRFHPYCKNSQKPDSFASIVSSKISLYWEMQTLVHSLPEPAVFFVLQKRYTRFTWLLISFFIILLLVLLLCYTFLV